MQSTSAEHARSLGAFVRECCASARLDGELVAADWIERELQREVAVLRVAHVVDVARGSFEGVLADDDRAWLQMRLQQLQVGG